MKKLQIAHLAPKPIVKNPQIDTYHPIPDAASNEPSRMEKMIFIFDFYPTKVLDLIQNIIDKCDYTSAENKQKNIKTQGQLAYHTGTFKAIQFNLQTTLDRLNEAFAELPEDVLNDLYNEHEEEHYERYEVG